MSDLISREDAIAKFKKSCTSESIDKNGIKRGEIHTAMTYEGIIKIIESLPSAEPEPEEFEWCTDCKEYDQEQHCCHRWTKVIRQTVEEMKFAEPERKTGKWIPFDLTWGRSVYSCTACGEAMDIPTETSKPIYNYCPNCGADMRGE